MPPVVVLPAIMQYMSKAEIVVVFYLRKGRIGTNIRMRQASTLQYRLILNNDHVFFQKAVNSLKKIFMKIQPRILKSCKL